MKRFFTAAVLLISILLLASCTNALDEDISTDTSSNTSANLTNTQTESNISTISITGEEIVTAEAQTDIQEERYDPVNDVYIIGTPLEYEQLEDFTFDYKLRYDFWECDLIIDFLSSLDNDEQKELYFKALSLIHLMSDTIGFQVSDSVDNNDNVYIKCGKNGYNSTFIETGYTFDSLFSVFCEVFTEEAAKKVIDHYPGFYEYNGELWYYIGSSSGNGWEVRREYELVNQTDTVLEFRRISFQDDFEVDEAGQDYDPDKRDKYIKEYIDFKFVLTDDGWRVEKFLNAEDPDKRMLFR